MYSCYLFLISSASLRYLPFLSFIEPIFAWNVPLLSLIFLKRSLVFPILLFSFYFFALITEEDFLISPCYSLELCIQMGISFLFSFTFHFPSFQEYTELYKKDLHDQENHNGVITYLEPDILECEVKWALGSITTNKASGGDGIPGEPFQILKDDAVKVLHSICQQIWTTQQWPQDYKRSVFILIPKKGNAKECSNYRTIALISHTSK